MFMIKLTVAMLIAFMDIIAISAGTKCEPMKVTTCREMPWTLTHMPNLVHHSSQKNAELVLDQFEPLLKLPRTDTLLFYLCSMFAPMCFQHEGELPKVVPPCRSICQEARSRVEPIMLKYNVSWPKALNCDDLPEYHRGMCIEPSAFITRPSKPNEDSCVPAHPVKCKKCPRFKVKTRKFKELDYDFVVRARVDKIVKNPCDAIAVVNVSKVFRMHTVYIVPGIQTLTFNTSCVCPNIRKKQEYILAGHQDPRTGKLLLHPESMAEKASRKSEKKVARLIKKMSTKPQRLNRRRRDPGNRKRGKKRPETIAAE